MPRPAGRQEVPPAAARRSGAGPGLEAAGRRQPPRSVPLSRARCAGGLGAAFAAVLGAAAAAVRGRSERCVGARRSGAGRNALPSGPAALPCPLGGAPPPGPCQRFCSLAGSERAAAGPCRARGSEVRTGVWLTDRNGEKPRGRQREARVGLPQALPPPPSAPETRRQSSQPQASAGRGGAGLSSFLSRLL